MTTAELKLKLKEYEQQRWRLTTLQPPIPGIAFVLTASEEEQQQYEENRNKYYQKIIEINMDIEETLRYIIYETEKEIEEKIIDNTFQRQEIKELKLKLNPEPDLK